MKRLISIVLVLLALGAAAFFFLKMRRFLPERPRGAELAPAETIFFAQLPNLRQTAARIPQSDLYRIWRGPDMQAFLEKPRRKVPWLRAWAERFDEIMEVAPGEFFLALTSIEGASPGFVSGFSFAGSQRDAEKLAAHLREQFLPGGEIVSSFRSNWYLCASDAGLLEAMLARFDGNPVSSLVSTRLFQQSIAPLGVGHDLVLYGKPPQLSGRLDFLTELGGQAQPNAQETVAMATRFEGRNLHDIIFLHGNGPAQPGTLSRQTLTLTSPQTLFYYAADLALLQPGPESGALKSLVPGLAGMEKRLAEKGLSWADLSGAIGPEWGIVTEWPDDAALPTLLLASEIRDAGKARTFMEVLTTPPLPEAPWRSEETDGVTLWNAPTEGFSIVRPTVALSDRFALLGMSPEVVTGALPKSKSPKPSIGQTVAFQDIAKSVPEQVSAFGIVDFKRLFERVYRMARPFITLSVAFSAEAGAQIDAGKLPSVESISDYLSTIVLTQSRIEDGTVIESVGSITLPELLFGVGAGGMATALPDLSKMLPVGIKGTPTRKPGSLPTAPIGLGGEAANSTPAPPIPEKIAPKHK